MKVVAVVPCRNEERYIGSVVSEAKRYTDAVVVVDNGSSDLTSSKALEAGAVAAVPCPIVGAGAATRLGIGYVLCFTNADIIVTLDGDGQHRPQEIPSMVEPIRTGVADLVIGSRLLRHDGALRQDGGGGMPRYRMLGNYVINLAYNLGHRPISDSQSGFRAFTREMALRVCCESTGFSICSEFLIRARRAGFRVAEVPITCIYHGGFGDNSSSNPFSHGLSVLASTLFWRLRLRD